MFEKLKKLFILSYIIGNKKKENFPAKLNEPTNGLFQLLFSGSKVTFDGIQQVFLVLKVGCQVR